MDLSIEVYEILKNMTLTELWSSTKRMVKMIDSIFAKILRAVFKISWNQHPTKRLLYNILPPIS